MKRTFLILMLAALTIAAGATAALAQKYTGSPVTKDRLLRVVRSKQFAVPVIIKQIKFSGVDFELTPAVDRELRAAGAQQQIIDAVSSSYRYAGRTSNIPPPVRDEPGEKYDQLYYSGIEALARIPAASSPAEVGMISRTVIDLGTQGIRAQPARFEAYTLVAAANLVTQNFTEAERFAQQAIDRGGSLAFPVYHLAGVPHLEFLHVGKGFVTVQSDQKFFEFDGAETAGMRQESPYLMGGVAVAVFSMSTVKNGRADVWYFAPGTTGTIQEAQMIMRLIQKNSIGGR
jgi:hypothetical protein